MTGISTLNLPRPSAVDELIGNRNEDGLHQTVRIKVDDLSNQMLADGPIHDEITRISDAQAAGAVNYETQAQLYADLGWSAGTAAKVWGDSDVNKRGIYKKNGAPSAGSWTRIGPLPEINVDVYLPGLAAAQAALTKIPRLENLFPNGNLDPNGAALKYFADLITPNTIYTTSIVPITQTTLNGLGCAYAMSLPASTTSRGNRLMADVNVVGGYVYASVLIYSADNTWVFGPNSANNNPIAVMRYTDGSSVSSAMGTYDTVATGVRRYYITLTANAAKTGYRLEIGLDADPPRTSSFHFTGFWASHSSAATVALTDTAYPQWRSALPVYPTVLANRVTALEKKSGFRALRDQLYDDFFSPNWCLIGNSITWGLGASLASISTPGAHALSDPRNNIDVSPSWANLLRKYLVDTFLNGATLTAGDPGVGYARKLATGDITGADPRFRVVSKTTGAKLPVTPGTNSGAYLGKYIDLLGSLPDYALEFEFTGDEIRIIHALLPTTPGATFSVEIDGSVVQTYSHYSSVAAFGTVRTVTTSFGRHICRIYNNSSTQNLRLEAVQHNRRLQIRNQGIIGTNSVHWLPTGSLLSGVDATDQTVIAQIGTNDRESIVGYVNQPARLRNNLLTIVDYLAPNRNIILMTPPRASTTYEYPNSLFAFDMADAANQIRHVARERDLSLIDNFAATSIRPTARMWSDGLHLNDYGNDIVFKSVIGSAGLTSLAQATAAPALSGAAYTLATVPSASAWPWAQLIITDAPGGGVPAFSDGTNWRSSVDRTVLV